MGSLLGSNVVGGIKLQVAAKDADRASDLLAEFHAESQPVRDDADDADDSDDGVPLKCPACGAEIWFPSEGGEHAETCPECGSQVDVPE